jgi:hypothetical protein
VFDGDTLVSCFGCMASNNTYTTDLCMEDGSYTVWGMDSYGDTWNGGNWEVTDSEGIVVATGSGPPSGVSGVYVAATFALGEAGVNVSGTTGFDGLALNDSETNDVFVTNAGYGAQSVLMVDSVKATNDAFSVSSVGTASLALTTPTPYRLHLPQQKRLVMMLIWWFILIQQHHRTALWFLVLV